MKIPNNDKVNESRPLQPNLAWIKVYYLTTYQLVIVEKNEVDCDDSSKPIKKLSNI